MKWSVMTAWAVRLLSTIDSGTIVLRTVPQYACTEVDAY